MGSMSRSSGMIGGLRLALAPRHAGGGGIAATALAFLAALLLAPGEARADNECGTISSTAQTATCTATHGGGSGTFGSGILYVNAAPGANNVATVVVPGGSTPWAVTAAAGSGNERKNAITLDSDGAAAGGLALTVGGASSTANQVAIARHATNTDTGDAGNGIYVNQQRTGASTTTLTVNAGVTIGTSSAPMRSHGIRANVWLGTGAATFTNAATIHSVSAGIYVNRGDSADTAAATTITNTGAITSGTRVIQLRYFAGDTTGSGGNTASTTTGAATITNSGVLTKNAGTGNQGAIELDYDRGHGDATITNRGAITYGSGATGGYGIYLNYNNRAGTATGDATIMNTAAIASAGHAIYLNYGGRGGATTITNSGALTATAASSFGIYLFEHGTLVDPATKVVTVTNSGDIRSTGLGINVNVRNKNIAGSEVGIAITHSAGDIVVSAAGGIKANIADNDDVAANNAGDIRIRVTGGSVQSRDTILEASHSQAGDVIFEVSDGVTLTSTAQHGIFANIPSANTVGDITVTNAGTITTPKTGIFIRSSAPTGTGDISVTNSGDIKKTGDTDWDGILVEDLGTGDITVRNSGNIGDADAMHERGIRVQKQAGAASGDVTITTTGGSIFADNVGIWVTDTDDHTGDVTISNGGDIMAERPISVVRNGGGAVSVTNTGGTVRSETLNAIAVRNKTGDASTVTVNVEGGTVRSPGNAIQAFNRGTGDVSMDFTGGELISEAGTAVYAVLPTTFHAGNQVKVAQGAKILGRTGFYANARGYSVADPVEARADGKPNVVDVTWTGSFSHGTTDAEKAMVAQDEDGRFAASSVGTLIFSQETLGGEDATDGVYGGAAGLEAQVMARREIIRQVALGDDPGAFADNAAQMADVPTGATAADNAYVAQLRAALGDARFDIDTSVFDAIKSGATSLAEVTDADIVTYLQTNNADTRTLLRNVLSISLSEKEAAVLKALATGDSTGLTTALNDADAAFSDDYKTAVRALLNRYNTGNIKVAMNGGSIDSRGDGIRAYYATANDNNGAIDVSVAEGASVTGGKTGIYVANAGLNAGEDADSTADDILKQTVTVHGMVTGGTDAAVHLVGGGTLTVGAMGKVVAGAGRPAILVNDPGRSEITILGEVEGSEGAAAAVDLSGGGSVTIGPMGRVNTNEGGATSAIKVAGGTYQIAIYTPDLATQDGWNKAVARVQGGIDTSADDGEIISRSGKDSAGNDVQAEEGKVTVALVETAGDYTTGTYEPLELNSDGDPVPGSNVRYGTLPACPDGQVLDAGVCGEPPTMREDDEGGPAPPEAPGGGGVRQPEQPKEEYIPIAFREDETRRSQVYEALPSVLLLANDVLRPMPELTSAAQDGRLGLAAQRLLRRLAGGDGTSAVGRAGWAQVEVGGGQWKPAASTTSTARPGDDTSYDYRRHGLRAGMDFALSDDARVGVSFHGLEASMEMAQAGEVDLSGYGLGVHGAATFDGGFHVGAQAAMTRYDADLESLVGDFGVLKKGVDGRGFALGVEVGRRMALDEGVSVTPRAGLTWAKAGLDDFREEPEGVSRPWLVSVEDATSLKGRVGASVEKLHGDDMDGTRLFGSVDVEQEFKEETEVKVSGNSATSEAEKTGFRLAIGGARIWNEGRYSVQGSVGYTAKGGDNRDLGGALRFSVRF